MDEILLTKEEKLRITTGKDSRWLEIGRDAVRAGFLKKLPGASLGILLFLLTHTDNGSTVCTDVDTISSFLPCDLHKTRDGLKYLIENKIITIDTKSGEIILHMENLNLNESHGKEDELKKVLKTYIPSDEDKQIVEKWLNDFDEKLLWELIRRVDKWFNQQKFNQTPENRFFYLMGIVDDWYEKEIHTYKRLQYFDRMYRETKILAETYGFKKWKNLNPVHMDTFKDWISGKNGLSLNVAKFAIKEAIKRKKDGQPSLKYIEDNFINPWKKAGIQNINQAKMFLSNKNIFYNTHRENDKKEKSMQWNNFSWDFNNFQET